MRGWSHGISCLIALPLGLALALAADDGRELLAAIVYGATVAVMFGASGAYHIVTWRGPWRARMCRVDHVGIYALIAGSYTPFGLLVLHGDWQIAVLATVWIGAAAAIVLKLCWVEAPKQLSAGIAIALGWVAVVVVPQIAAGVGLTACALVVAGGLAYTAGGLVYAFRRPDPVPRVFGYHELFHALVIVAVCLQYASIAFFVLPHA